MSEHMPMTLKNPSYVRQLIGRGMVLVVAAYVLTLGGTFNGLLLARVQQFSLVCLTVGIVIWQGFVWWRRDTAPFSALDPALALWSAAYIISGVTHHSGRVLIGVWWALLYLGVWWLLSDLRRRGMPGRWITDAGLIALIPVMLLAVLQVGVWFPMWLRLDTIRVAFIPPRPPATLGNANALGMVLAMLLPLGLVRVRWSWRRMDRILWAVWVGGALVVLLLTFSRGAWLALFAAAITFGSLMFAVQSFDPATWWRSRSLATRRRIFASVLGGLGIILLVMVLSFSAFATPRRDTSTRLTLFGVAWDMFREQPLTGTGPFTFGSYWLADRSVPPDQPHAHAHNLILNVAGEMGVVGLAALLATAALIGRYGWQALRRTSDPAERAHLTACGAALVAASVHSMVEMPLLQPAVMLVLLGIVATLIVQEDQGVARDTYSLRAVGYRFVTLIVWVIVLGSGWWSTRVYDTYERGERALAAGDLAHAVDLLGAAAETWPDIALYDAEYGYACGVAAAQGADLCLADGIAAYERALTAEPENAVWWANLAALYWAADQPDAALTALQQATDRAPDSPDLWLNLGIFAEAVGQGDRALAAYENALEADPAWDPAMHFWTQTPLRETAARQYSGDPAPLSEVAGLMTVGDLRGAIAILEAEIDRDPSQPWPYANLARVYLAAGDYDRARAYLDAARVLVHTPAGAAWVKVGEAELVRAEGDSDGYATLMQEARDILWPDDTGHPLSYGNDVAYLQFLRVRVPGTLLPQLTVYGSEPTLVELLQADQP